MHCLWFNPPLVDAYAPISGGAPAPNEQARKIWVWEDDKQLDVQVPYFQTNPWQFHWHVLSLKPIFWLPQEAVELFA